eukprot:10328968-Prorocentrum_lima.AAC.1
MPTATPKDQQQQQHTTALWPSSNTAAAASGSMMVRRMQGLSAPEAPKEEQNYYLVPTQQLQTAC